MNDKKTSNKCYICPKGGKYPCQGSGCSKDYCLECSRKYLYHTKYIEEDLSGKRTVHNDSYCLSCFIHIMEGYDNKRYYFEAESVDRMMKTFITIWNTEFKEKN